MTFTDFVFEERGTRNWVVARRTPRLVAKHGADVLALSREEYRALQHQFKLRTVDEHPAYPVLGNRCDACNTLKLLIEEGFTIERAKPFGERVKPPSRSSKP